MEQENKISLETMLGIGKNKKIAGRDYYILPVNISDMHYIMGEDAEEKLIILDRKQLEKEDEVNWQLFGLNITEPKRKEIFMKIIEKYVFYCVNDNKIPMTEKMLIEHNWSFKEIGEFLFTWCQISD